MSKRAEERILCFPSSVFDALGRFQGLSLDVSKYIPDVVTPPTCHTVLRSQAENDPSEKQIIPYALFVHEDMIFAYRRGKHGGETRLHELYSVGIGGHIKWRDRSLFGGDHIGYRKAMLREVEEEVEVKSPWQEACVALINDDTNEVGQVHFGVVHLFKLAAPLISKRESSITDARLVPVEKATKDISQYETWSQLCLANFRQLMDAFLQCHP